MKDYKYVFSFHTFKKKIQEAKLTFIEVSNYHTSVEQKMGKTDYEHYYKKNNNKKRIKN